MALVVVATIIIIITHICKLVVLRYCKHTPLGYECPDAILKFRMWDVGTLVFYLNSHSGAMDSSHGRMMTEKKGEKLCF